MLPERVLNTRTGLRSREHFAIARASDEAGVFEGRPSKGFKIPRMGGWLALQVTAEHAAILDDPTVPDEEKEAVLDSYFEPVDHTDYPGLNRPIGMNETGVNILGSLVEVDEFIGLNANKLITEVKEYAPRFHPGVLQGNT